VRVCFFPGAMAISMACVFGRVFFAWSTLDTVFALCADLIYRPPLAVDLRMGGTWSRTGNGNGTGNGTGNATGNGTGNGTVWARLWDLDSDSNGWMTALSSPGAKLGAW